MVISDYDYNKARMILIDAGSQTAKASHPAHTRGAGSPAGHGQGLLREARNEFRRADVGQANLRSGLTPAHYNTIHNAANQMNIREW